MANHMISLITNSTTDPDVYHSGAHLLTAGFLFGFIAFCVEYFRNVLPFLIVILSL